MLSAFFVAFCQYVLVIAMVICHPTSSEFYVSIIFSFLISWRSINDCTVRKKVIEHCRIRVS